MPQSDPHAQENDRIPRDVRDAIHATFLGQAVTISKLHALHRHNGAFDAIVDVVIQQPPRASTARARRAPVRQTVALFYRPHTPFPQFTIAPNRGSFGRLLLKLVSLTGLRPLEFPDDPAFATAFSVLTLEPARTRPLLTPRIREALLQQPDLSLVVGPHRIAAYHQGQLIPPDQLPLFHARAREIADMFVEEAATLADSPPPTGDTLRNTVQETALLTGPFSRAVSITRTDIDELLMQPPPRSLPPSIKSRAHGGSGFLLLWTGFVAIVLTIITLVAVVGNAARKNFPPAVPYVLGGVAAAAAGGFLLVLLYRYRRRQLLTYGRIETGTVVDVTPTNMYINSDQMHVVEFDTPSGRIRLRVGSREATLARRLQASGQPTRLVVDPLKPASAIWIDSWPVDAYLDL